jgi:hypothetical protein
VISAEREVIRVFALNQAMTEQGSATLGQLAELGLATVAGQLTNPCGYWHCAACWMDYPSPGYRQPNFFFTSGAADPFKFGAKDRRFMVVYEVEPPNDECEHQ